MMSQLRTPRLPTSSTPGRRVSGRSRDELRWHSRKGCTCLSCTARRDRPSLAVRERLGMAVALLAAARCAPELKVPELNQAPREPVTRGGAEGLEVVGA